jgi:hypothetical protein
LESKTTQNSQTISELNQRIEALEAELPLDARSNVDPDTSVEAEDLSEGSKARRARARVQMIHLLDLTDNNDTEAESDDSDVCAI